MLAEGTSRAARAMGAWRRGLELTLEGLAGDPDSYVLKLLAVTFRGLARDAAFPDDAARIMTDIRAAGVNPFALMYLGIAYAHRGDSASAIDILRYGLAHGRLAGRGWWTVWTPALKQAPGFMELIEDYDREADRRRRLYGSAS